MKEYASSNLRNVGIIAHGRAGKTSLTEACLFCSGSTKRLGRVDDGTAVTDFEPEEVRRKVSINAALAPCQWQGCKINMIDTPGYSDFVAEVKGTLAAVDGTVVVVCAVSGVEVETEKVWRYAQQKDLPRILFVNKMDRENADFSLVLNDMRTVFGSGVVAAQLPIGAQENFQGIIDVITMKALIVDGGNRYSEADIPAGLYDAAMYAHQQLVEAVAEIDDDLLTKYLEGEELSHEDIRTALAQATRLGKVFPVFCGSAYLNIGIPQLLDAVDAYLPPPGVKVVMAKHVQTQEDVEIENSAGLVAMVFKTTADTFVGRLSYIRLFSGCLKSDTVIYNASKGKNERIGNLFTLRGKQQEMVGQACAGDIVVVAKLQDTATGDTLCEKNNAVLVAPACYPKAMFTMCLELKNKGDEDKIGPALSRMMDEDPSIKTSKDGHTGQLLVSGLGDLHLDIMRERLKRKFGVDVFLKTPRVAYRETVRGSVKVEGKHKKQSGGHGQYGHVWLQIDPLAPGGGFEFVDSIFGGSVPRQYIPAVEKGVREALGSGILAGFPMVDVRVTLCDGSYHNVDSSEMAFKIASALALRKGAMQAQPVLLEPVYNLEVHVPQPLMGDIIGDLNGKRARILGMAPIGGVGIIKAQVPMAELFRYAIELRSITQGRGTFDMDFSHYEEVPHKLAESIVAGAKKSGLAEA